MFSKILRSRLVAAAMSTLALSSSMGLAAAEELCSVVPYTFGVAKSSYPQLSTALGTLENYAIASWFTDRISTQDRANLMSRMLNECPDESRLSIVVYGIPNKDCSGGYSTSGSVTSSAAYRSFLKELTDAVGDRKVLYVVEPDAVGLLSQDNGCGGPAGYLENLKIAVNALSANANAQLYLDVGYWMLADTTSASKVATVMQQLGSAGRVKGVTINTSNYRSNAECAGYCSTFQRAMGSDDMHCIVDTSRNYNGSPTNDWCNIPTAGIGKPPTSNTGYANLDYFMWIKPPGESDGYCWGGPSAGSFFLDGFTLLWNQGYFVKEMGMPRIGETLAPTSAPTSAPSAPTSAPVTCTPSSTTAPVTYTPDTTAPTTPPTAAPVTWAPSYTTAPATYTPDTTTPTTPPTAAPVTWAPSYTTAPATYTPDTAAPTAASVTWSYGTGACKTRKRVRS